MDIKSLVRSIVPFSATAESAVVKRRSLTESASDRDANGRQEQAEEQPKRNLTPEEIDEVVKYLESLAGVKDNNLTVRLVEHNGIRVVFVEDHTGKVIRRIPEADMGALLKNKNQPDQKKSGNLLNKTA